MDETVTYLLHKKYLKNGPKVAARVALEELLKVDGHISNDVLAAAISASSYAIPIGKPSTEPEDWLRLAAHGDRLRNSIYLTALVQDGKKFASDGHRIHWIHTEEEDGVYSLITGRRFEGLGYPVGVIQGMRTSGLLRVDGNTFKDVATPAESDGKTPLCTVGDTLVTAEYLTAAMRPLGNTVWLNKHRLEPLIIHNTFGGAVIMPRRK